jgi:hypothetical protein
MPPYIAASRQQAKVRMAGPHRGDPFSRTVCSLLIGLVFLYLAPSSIAATGITKREVAVLDLAGRNNDTPFSTLGLKQALEVAGTPYVVTTSLDVAIRYPIVITTSWLAPDTFGATATGRAQKDQLIAYVDGGGVIVATDMYDAYLYPLFGVSHHLVSRTRYTMSWQTATGDPRLGYFDDPNEQTISLGGSTHQNVIKTRGYRLTTARPLARFDDASAAITRNAWGTGKAYAVGFSYTDLILRSQLDRDFDAERMPCDGFEPTADTIMLFLRKIYETHVPYAPWKFTAPFPARSVLMLTHDVHPQKKSFDLALDFARFENSAGVTASYNIQTNYLSDANGDSYIPYLPQLRTLAASKHVIGTHTVGHFKDWANETDFPIGSPGNTNMTYRPVANGNTTTAGTVSGEIEVPKFLIRRDTGIDVRTFRSGMFYWNDKQTNALQALGYDYDSSNRANDVLTNFPYRLTLDRAFDGAVSTVYEIPLTLHDLGLNATNYQARVTHWLSIIDKNAANFAPTTILIHPQTEGALAAEKSLLQQLGPGIAVRNINNFGDFWRARDTFRFRTSLAAGKLTLTVLDGTPLPTRAGFSLYLKDGAQLSSIVVRTQSGVLVQFQKASDGGDGLFLHGFRD